MASMKYCDKNNQVEFLKKPKESIRFAEIVDFLKGSHISKLKLAAASGISMLPNTEIFEGMGNMGYLADVVVVDQSAGQADQAVDQPSSSEPLPSSSHPPVQSTTTESEPTPVADQITHPTSFTPELDSEPIEHTFEQPSLEHLPLSPRQEIEVPLSQDPTHPHVAEARTMTVDDLLQLVPKLITKEKKIAREVELKKQRVFNPGDGVAKLVWNNAHRVNHANHFVPRPVHLNFVRRNVNSVRTNVNSVRHNVNSVRPSVNTGRVNVNSVKSNVNSVRHNVNSARTNVTTGRSKQPVPTCNSNSFSLVKPQVNKFNQRSHFSKSHSPVRRPIVRNTAKMSYTHVVKRNWGTAVKTSTSYNWRKTRPKSNCNSGSNFIRIVNVKGPQGRPKPEKDRGIFDSRCLGHMTGNKDHLDDFEECKGGSVTFGETDKEESVEAMNPTPLDTKSNIVLNWKIFQQGERSIYQIIRENRADIVYMSFGAMLKDFIREDLIELYRLVMQKYGTNMPEEAYDRVLWSNLRTMFDPPLNEDAIWSLPLQQNMISLRNYEKCAVHCLTFEACNIYMLVDRKYPVVIIDVHS
ncbi:hypothetical protein Tco_0540417 [Tanacetum coccineum]